MIRKQESCGACHETEGRCNMGKQSAEEKKRMEGCSAVTGCIADDFTGASDAASFLKAAGFRPILFNGVPKEADGDLPEADAFVIALKTRTMPEDKAAEQVLEAAEWLKEQGVSRFYFKYCSTFDSTPTGNIGPSADALMKFCGVKYTILCPALPVNRRQVISGHIYVDGKPLHESSMKDHPLTPMWDSWIPALMKGQSAFPCHILTRETMKDAAELVKQIDRWKEESPFFYLIPDYENEDDGRRIVEVFGEEKLLTGGSGLLAHMTPGSQRPDGSIRTGRNIRTDGVKGKTLFLSGSCSRMTLRQVQEYKRAGGKVIDILPESLFTGKTTEQDYIRELELNTDDRCMFCSSAAPEDVRRAQKMGKEEVAGRLEALFAALASRAAGMGYQKIITAGGETSGAVIRGLGFSAFRIGESVAPGVPALIPAVRPDLRLVLKSGNFGAEDFFKKAEELCSDGSDE